MNHTIESIVNQLGYSSDNLIEANDEYYDYYYRLKIPNVETTQESVCDIIGIKAFSIVDEDEISKYHRVYWNKNDLPISILIFTDEVRVYNNFVCKREKRSLQNWMNYNRKYFIVEN